MILGDFKIAVANFMNRSTTLFGVGGPAAQDKLLLACNMMKAYAQRSTTFEMAKTVGTLVIDKTNGGLVTAVLNGAGQPIRIRSVLRAWLPSIGPISQLYPVDVITRDQQLRSLQRATENIDPRYLSPSTLVGNASYVALVQDGWTLRVWPWPTGLYTGATTTATLDVVQWLPDYSADADEDFLLKECLDWALYQTAFHANFFLKDDQRVSLSAQIMKDLWSSVKTWNASLVEGVVPVTLD